MWPLKKRFIFILSITLSIYSNINPPSIRQANAQEPLTAKVMIASEASASLMSLGSVIGFATKIIPPDVYLPLFKFTYDCVRSKLNRWAPSYLPSFIQLSFCELNPAVCMLGKAIKPTVELWSLVDNEIFKDQTLKKLNLDNKSINRIGNKIGVLHYLNFFNSSLLIASIIHNEIRFRQAEEADQKRHENVMAQINVILEKVNKMESKIIDRIDRKEMDELLTMIKVAINCNKKLRVNSSKDSVNICLDNISKARVALNQRKKLPTVSLDLSKVELLLYQLHDPENTGAIRQIHDESEQIFKAAIKTHTLLSSYCKKFGKSVYTQSSKTCKPNGSWLSKVLKKDIDRLLRLPDWNFEKSQLIASKKEIDHLTKQEMINADLIIIQIDKDTSKELDRLIQKYSDQFKLLLNKSIVNWKQKFKVCSDNGKVNSIIEEVLSSSKKQTNVQLYLNHHLSNDLTQAINDEIANQNIPIIIDHSRRNLSQVAQLKDTSSLAGSAWGAFASVNAGVLGMTVFAGYNVYTTGVIATVMASGMSSVAKSVFVPSLTLAAIVGVSATLGAGVWYYKNVQEYEENRQKYIQQICREVLDLESELKEEILGSALLINKKA